LRGRSERRQVLKKATQRVQRILDRSTAVKEPGGLWKMIWWTRKIVDWSTAMKR
jgi:hypothetical protein